MTPDPNYLPLANNAISRRNFLGKSACVGLGVSCLLGKEGYASLPGLIVDAVLPDAPPYPSYADKAVVEAQAQKLSDDLELHIKRWLDGTGPSAIPKSLMPVGMQPGITDIRLVTPDDVSAEEQWIVRPAEMMYPGQPLDLKNLRPFYPDPHVTYAIPGLLYLPFGAKIVVDGEFPHARFFDLQVSPPFDPAFYYYDTTFGAPEVPIVDADIDPLPGHVNPFRLGTDRNATRRKYQVEFEMIRGNGVEIEPAYRQPLHRKRGNKRFGSAIQYQGPLGMPGAKGGHGRGVWDSGILWLRYYAPDSKSGPLGGVNLPKISYQLKDGRRFYITANFEKRTKFIGQRFAAHASKAKEPAPRHQGATVGWLRSLDIFEGGIEAIYFAVGKSSATEKAKGRALIKGAVARGDDLPAPGYYMSANSKVPFVSYLGRSMALGKGRILVLTGKLPQFPRTRAGEQRLRGGQVRYFSITTYPTPDWLDLKWIGVAHTSVMDDEIITDKNGNYVIVYSRPEDRPKNTRAGDGVTWLNWGPASEQSMVVRWLTVHSEWRDARIVPDSSNISYSQASWLNDKYDPSLVGRNDRSGLLGVYHPVLHYMKPTEFENLGTPVDADTVPAWQ